MKGVICSKEYAGGMQHLQIGLNDSVVLNAVSQSAEMDIYPLGSKVFIGWDILHAPVVADEEAV